jgi:branched-chain amino acid aminotransferase
MQVLTTDRAAAVAAPSRFADGAAYVDDAYVPVAEARIPILDWGFLRSDSTYDVAHVWKGRFFRLERHLERFEASMAGLRMTIPHKRGELVEILLNLVRLSGLRDAYVHMLCTRGTPPKGTRDPRRCLNRFAAFAVPFIWIADEAMRRRGIDLHISSVPRIPPESVDPRIKNYHWGDMTRSLFEAYDVGCDMPVLLDLKGNVAEGPGFNLFCVKDGTVTTPAETCLGGITRQTALDLLADLNVKTVIGDIPKDALKRADEVFITSTAGGVIAVARIDHAPVADGEIGPLTKRLVDLYWQRHDEGWEATPVDYAAEIDVTMR